MSVSRLAVEGEWRSTVARLRCFRGIDTLSAFALTLEIGDCRFRSPRLASWLGLGTRSTSPGAQSRGSDRKTGSGYARRLLVEAAWHYLRQPAVRAALAARQHDQPAQVLRIAWRAQHRLYRLHARLRARGKPANVATIAAAREARLLPLGRRRGRMTPTTPPPARAGAGQSRQARAMPLWAAPAATPARRQRTPGDATRALG
ncbi:MAG: transposase [Gaiellales bacterium]